MQKLFQSFTFRMVVSIVLAAALIASAWLLFDGISSEGDGAQTTLVKEAIRRALVTCYVVEGYYPSDVEVLKESYGLRYDEEHYFVVLDGFAFNVMPDIRVVRRGAE